MRQPTNGFLTILMKFADFSAINFSRRLLFVLSAFLPLFARWPGHDSEDIKNLRINVAGAHPTDFWGGASSLFYGHFPNLYPGWETLLLLFQWLLACSGLFLVSRNLHISRALTIPYFLVVVISVEFATFMTRDGLMLSILLLGIGLIQTAHKSDGKTKKYLKGLALFCFLFAAWFRPWVSPAIYVLFLFVNPRPRLGEKACLRISAYALIILSFSTIALGLEVVTSKALHLEKSYPEQQVMMMDLSAMACWSTNQDTVDKAVEGLRAFYVNEDLPTYFCNTFRPTNWIHLFHKDLLSAQQPEFRLIQAGDMQTYEKVRSSWVKTIVSSPVDYVQNKFMYGSQTLLGGDTRRIRALSGSFYTDSSRSTLFTLFSGMVMMPLDLITTLHLLSPMAIFAALALGLWLPITRRQFNYSNASKYFKLAIFQVFWSLGTVIAYIGDTARFTYSSGVIVFLMMFIVKMKSNISV